MKMGLWLRVLTTPRLGEEKMLHHTVEWPKEYRVPVVGEHVPLLWTGDPDEGDASLEVTRISWGRDRDLPGWWPVMPHLEFGLYHTDGAGTDTRTPYIERELLDRMAAEGWSGWP